MNSGKYLFAQVTSFLPANDFIKCVKKYNGNYKVKHFTCWHQLMCMVFGQLSNRDSLSDLVVCLATQHDKWYHLGMGTGLSKSNLAYANEHRDWRIFAEYAYILIAEASVDKFVLHLLSNVYFVVVETKAGLAKTLKIFNAINTTGLDLNGGDIFKIRMYEYLTEKKGRDEAAFDEISRLYQIIDEKNSLLKYDVTDIKDILKIYQYVLIARYDLPLVLYGYGADRFFDRLFETLFNINQWEHFKNNVQEIELSVQDIEEIIEARYDWEINWFKTAENLLCYKLIEMSRYGKYCDVLPTILIYADKKSDRYTFITQLSKLYIIYSIRFKRSIYDIDNFTYALIKIILHNSFDEIINFINKKIGTESDHNNGYYDLNWVISGSLTDNFKRKIIICRLSAMLDEDYLTNNEEKISELKKKLFETAIDIEHIQSYHDHDGDKREDIWNEWQENLNSLGNLMVLEQELNRSISNNPYEIKTEHYQKSVFSIVSNQCSKFSSWDLQKCLERKEKEKEKIVKYLFN